MKLVTLKDGSRDGQLAILARDLKTAYLAGAIDQQVVASRRRRAAVDAPGPAAALEQSADEERVTAAG